MNKTITEIQKDLREGKTTSVQLTEEYLKRAEKSDLNAYITIDREGAFKAAGEADEKIKSGDAQPLCGIPFGIKDAISTKGLRTTSASKILDSYVPPFDAAVISRLRAQGAIIIGKNNMDEFAMGSSTENSAYGPVFNPHDKSRVPGGSSGGSTAAVAADLCVASLGSDTGGSIRQPAAFCGVVGFKPTYGRVSRYGLIAMASSLDQIGPITKTVADAKIVFNAIKGRDEKDATSIGEQRTENRERKTENDKMRVGVMRSQIENDSVDEVVKININQAIEKIKSAGHEVVDIEMPSIDNSLAVYYIIMPIELSSNLARFDGIKYGASVLRDGDVKNLLDVYFKTRSKYLGAEAKRRIILGAYASSAGYIDKYYKKAQAAKEAIINDFKNTFEKVDMIIGPTTPSTAFKLGEKSADPMQMYLSDVYTVPANIAGLPSISIPLKTDDLPVGLQITGNKNADEEVLNFAEKVEEILS